MSETDPGYDSEHHAGDVGARRARVGTPTERESINVPPTRPGAAENAQRAEAAREEHETFIPEAPIRDERSEATESLRTEEESLQRTHGDADDQGEGDVRKDIKETRQELGDTVGALAGKADLKGKASNAAETAKDKAGEAVETAKDKAGEAVEAVKSKAGDAAEAVKTTATDAAEEAKKRPVLLIAAAGAVAAFVVRRIMRRRKGK
ncbi:DUF3618 domain-containing protein [Nonomuraea sp. 10N515B]|uniref:DUF3618 domain-containing protein n=1 Tax=Nonomuraea sp. 10N515B TaxID=3457422 RepID=UPI003FCD7468